MTIENVEIKGSRGLGPLVGGSEGGQSPSFYFALWFIF